MVLNSYPLYDVWWWIACISQWIWFWWWRTWFTGVGFLCRNFLDNRCGVAKGIVHVVDGRENVVTGLFKTECGGWHVTIDRCSGKKVIRLGSCWCYFFWFYKILSSRYLSLGLSCFGPVMPCLWKFYKFYIRVISHLWILYITIDQLGPVHIPGEKLWLVQDFKCVSKRMIFPHRCQFAPWQVFTSGSYAVTDDGLPLFMIWMEASPALFLWAELCCESCRILATPI